MTILYKDKIMTLLHNKELIIESTDERIPFDPESQITSDTIELRLCPKGLIYKGEINIVDTLTSEPEEMFEPISIPLSGYVLEPGNIIFSSSLEIVCITNGAYVGRISSRGTFSRFGISVTCGRSKVPAGTPHTPDLQIANHSSKPIRIYPYSFILQIQLETTTGSPQPYDGIYPKSIGPVPPKISERDRSVSVLLSKLALESKPSKPAPDPGETAKIVERISTSAKLVSKSHFRIVLSTKMRSSLGVLFGILTTLTGGFLVNMLTAGDWSYWKILTVVLSGILLVFLLILDLAVIFGSAPN